MSRHIKLAFLKKRENKEKGRLIHEQRKYKEDTHYHEWPDQALMGLQGKKKIAVEPLLSHTSHSQRISCVICRLQVPIKYSAQSGRCKAPFTCYFKWHLLFQVAPILIKSRLDLRHFCLHVHLTDLIAIHLSFPATCKQGLALLESRG